MIYNKFYICINSQIKRIDQERDLGKIWTVVSFFGPCWILYIMTAFFFVSVLYTFCTVNKTLQKHMSWAEKRNYVQKNLSMYTKLIFYPLVFLLVWIFPTLNRIVTYIRQGDAYYPLVVITVFIMPLHGAFNVLIYVLNPVCYIYKIINYFNILRFGSYQD